MRITLAAIIVAAASGFFNTSSASAALTNGVARVGAVMNQTNQVTQVAGGCGAGRHRGPRGGCIRN
jgi:hypothetical protein